MDAEVAEWGECMFTGASEPDGRAAVVIIDADCGIYAHTGCPWNSPDALANRERRRWCSPRCIRDGGERLQRHRTEVSVAEHSIGLRVAIFFGTRCVGCRFVHTHDDRVQRAANTNMTPHRVHILCVHGKSEHFGRQT